ncbi:hypothetical protein MSKU15_2985 [Komagataeibacter diospyri]|nr:hypothetical protein MSKU15_2985 [Komagataeibacter diospyri]
MRCEYCCGVFGSIIQSPFSRYDGYLRICIKNGTPLRNTYLNGVMHDITREERTLHT